MIKNTLPIKSENSENLKKNSHETLKALQLMIWKDLPRAILQVVL